MSAVPVRPVTFGFDPEEISSLCNRRVVEEHAGEAGFLWMLRRRAVRAPHYKLHHLARLDERVSAHLAGLRVAGEFGWQAAQRQVGSGDAGAVFTLAWLAFQEGRPERMRDVLVAALAQPDFTAALVSALAWLPAVHVGTALRRLAASPVAAHRWVALAVCGARRADPAADLARGLADDDASVRARAWRAAGDLMDPAGLRAAGSALGDAEPGCRFWAARCRALAGDRPAAQIAFETGCAHPALAREAVEVGMRCGDPGWARDAVRSLAAEGGQRRLAVAAAGALGDPAAVGWLIEACADVELAPAAGEAVAMITGVDLAYLDLDQDRADDAPEPPPRDRDLPLPDRARLARWWSGVRDGFSPGHRYLGGARVSPVSAAALLRRGYQRQRRAAAFELARLDGRPVFAVDERADWQARRLSA